jgi:tetratricopeptide (TPR) repeat protein
MNLTSIQREQPTSQLRKHFLLRCGELEPRVRAGTASIEDIVNLGAYRLRLGQIPEAAEILTQAVSRDRNNFMALANLGTAFELDGRIDRALDCLQQLKEVWPAAWPGFTPAQLAWYRRAEGYQFSLLRARALHAARDRAQERGVPGLDDLFGVRFVDEGGAYAPGSVSASERAKLPPDALAVVQQLLIWMPADTRLYWLLAELMNANGDIAGAASIMEECAWARRYDAPGLRQHRQVLQEAIAAVRPRESPVPPAPAQVPSPVESTAGWRVEPRTLVLVGIGAFFAVLALVYLQLREMRHGRRKGSASRTQ